MGIFRFFKWYKDNFSKHITKVRNNDTLKNNKIIVDNFMIDLNGLFHGSAQKIYKYGEHAPLPRLLKEKHQDSLQELYNKQTDCFKDICESIEQLVKMVEPQKRLILCIDGPAPIAKQAQQRKRRFKSAMERKKHDNSFDSCSITPGTKWMHYLSKYIDWYIKKNMSDNPLWQNIEVVFSNEKVCGEGEHKIINYIRRYGKPEETFCIHGADADLIMLALGTHYPNFYIIRDDIFNHDENHVINIGSSRKELANMLCWTDIADKENEGEDDKPVFDEKLAINDFILMCFMVGNDFLPHMPAIEIIQNGIDTMISVYKQTCSEYGHLTTYSAQNKVRFVKNSFKMFLGEISTYEKLILQEKLESTYNFYQNSILENNSEQNQDGTYSVNIKKYRKEYYQYNLPNIKRKNICRHYLEGMQWVLSYYIEGVPSWKWSYPYHYAPFAYTLAKYMDYFKFPAYGHSTPTIPFIQLLSVLPPRSAHLIPAPLKSLLLDKESPLRHYYPNHFKVDLSGKKNEYEGTVILPMVDYDLVEKEYMKLYSQVDRKDKVRNIIGKSFLYTYTPSFSYVFRSPYGNVNCKVKNQQIRI